MKRSILVSALLLLGCLGAQLTVAADWKDALKEQFKTAYTFSKTSRLAPDRVTEPGTVLVISKEGVLGDLSSDAFINLRKISNGEIKAPGGFSALIGDKKTTHVFKAGERLYVTDVKLDDDNVTVMFVSVDSYDVNVKGSTQHSRYKGGLKFEYPKNYVQSAGFEKLKNDIDAIAQTEDAAKAVNTKTIELGQTIAQVESIFGKPDTIVNLGSKVTYNYKNMKIIFVDGKVSDVQ